MSPQIDSTPGPNGADYLSPIGILNVFLRQRRILIAVPLLCLALAGAYLFAQRDEYVATSQFLLTGGQQASAASALAAQLGFGSVGTRGESPELYASLVESQGVLRNIASRSYQLDGDTTLPLSRIYEAEGETEEAVLRATVAKLEDAIATRVNPTTGVVAVEVRAESPRLAVQLADQLVDELARFNLENRQRQAEAEREFIEERLQSAEAGLAGAEAALRTFLERNRTYATSPELTQRYASLQRDVSLRQQVFTSLAQSLEQARIDAVRNTPLFTVVERAEHTVRPRSRSLLLLLALALLGGLFAGVAIVFTRDFLQRGLTGDPAERAELSELLRQAHLRRPTGAPPGD